MATRIAEGTKLKREISVMGIHAPVEIEITSMGIFFHVKGSRKKTYTTWRQAAGAGTTNMDVPSFLMNKPIELLQHYASQR